MSSQNDNQDRFTARWSPLGQRREPVTGWSVENCLAKVAIVAACSTGPLPYTVEVIERVPVVEERVVYRGRVENPGGC
jgi:hypothetical protein